MPAIDAESLDSVIFINNQDAFVAPSTIFSETPYLQQ